VEAVILFMSLNPIASFLLWGINFIRYHEVVSTIVPKKQCHKVISHTAKFSLFTIWEEVEQKVQYNHYSLNPRPFYPSKAYCKRAQQILVLSPMKVPPHLPNHRKVYSRALCTPNIPYSLAKSSHTRVIPS
jgi:hypothetical protein